MNMNGIWVRSQDKRVLVWVEKFDVCSCEVYAKGTFGDLAADSEVLGKYESNERAIEVLDEILAAILSSTHKVYNAPPLPALSFYNVATAYQMPEE